MRAPGTVGTAGLAAAAVIVLLTACGGSDGSASSASPTGSTGGSAGGSAAFCSQALDLSSKISSTLAAAGTDPAQVAPVLQRAADQYSHVTPPAAIKSDWDLIAGAVQTLATAAQQIDFTAADAADRLAASISGREGELNTATTDVETYATKHCPAASGSPTSAPAT